MRVAILGPLEVRRDGEVVPIGGRRVAALLARLAIDRGRLVSASALIDAVWEEELPADPAHALHLTARGKRLLARGRSAIANAEQAFMAPLPEAEQERLKQALRALIEAGER